MNSFLPFPCLIVQLVRGKFLSQLIQVAFSKEIRDHLSPQVPFTLRNTDWSTSLARKNHAKAEAKSSLRARKLLNKRCASVQEPVLQLKIRNNLFLNSS